MLSQYCGENILDKKLHKKLTTVVSRVSGQMKYGNRHVNNIVKSKMYRFS